MRCAPSEIRLRPRYLGPWGDLYRHRCDRRLHIHSLHCVQHDSGLGLVEGYEDWHRPWVYGRVHDIREATALLWPWLWPSRRCMPREGRWCSQLGVRLQRYFVWPSPASHRDRSVLYHERPGTSGESVARENWNQTRPNDDHALRDQYPSCGRCSETRLAARTRNLHVPHSHFNGIRKSHRPDLSRAQGKAQRTCSESAGTLLPDSRRRRFVLVLSSLASYQSHPLLSLTLHFRYQKLLNASIVDCVFEMKREVTVEEVNQLLTDASKGDLQNILGVETKPLVSVDFMHDPRSGHCDSFPMSHYHDLFSSWCRRLRLTISHRHCWCAIHHGREWYEPESVCMVW